MTREENIILAKRTEIDNIYKSAHLEGIASTFAETVDIIENKNSHGLLPDEIATIRNLKRAWEFLLNNLDKKLNFDLFKELHKVVSFGLSTLKYDEMGELRYDGVNIGGTLWRPELPDINKLYNELQDILRIENKYDMAITLNLWFCKSQMFKDCNKRMGNLICNFVLINNGLGIVSVPIDKINEFKDKLIKFYETGDDKDIKEFFNYVCYAKDSEYLSAYEKELSKNLYKIDSKINN